MSTSFNIFPFDWSCIDDKRNKTNTILIWGWNELNQSIVARITNFKIPIWVQFPDKVCDASGKEIRKLNWQDRSSIGYDDRKQIIEKYLLSVNSEWGGQPKTITTEYRSKLYFAHMERIINPTASSSLSPSPSTQFKYKQSMFPVLRLDFTCQSSVSSYAYKLKQLVDVPGIGWVRFIVNGASNSLSPDIKLASIQQLPFSSWISGQGNIVTGAFKRTSCAFEYNVDWNKLKKHDNPESLPIVYPKVLSFDIEAYSQNKGAMPKSENPSDCSFMIGFTISQKNQPTHKIMVTTAPNILKRVYLGKELYWKRIKRAKGKMIKTTRSELAEREAFLAKFNIQVTQEQLKTMFLSPLDKHEEQDFTPIPIPSLGNVPDPDPYEVREFNTEIDLYREFTKIVKEYDPDVIMGYNIFGWDILFMEERWKNDNGGQDARTDWKSVSRFSNMKCEIESIEWGSSAYGKQIMKYIKAPGRLFLDMRFYINRTYSNLSSYRLESVCAEFLKTNKDPIKPEHIFKSWENKDPELLTLVSNYCIQDTNVVVELYENRYTWFDLMETATINCVRIFHLYTRGQQIKMYSQVFRYCYHNMIQIQDNDMEVDEDFTYQGAIVTKPISGLYRMVLPFDFASLYPSIIMAHNIDFSRLVDDSNGKRIDIPDEDCGCFVWSEHSACFHAKGCEKDVERLKPKKKNGKATFTCADYNVRYLKHEVAGKGVIPTLLQNLINERKSTRKIIAKNEEKMYALEEFLIGSHADRNFIKEWALKKAQKEKVTIEDPDAEVTRLQNVFINPPECIKSIVADSNNCTESAIYKQIKTFKELNGVLDKRQLALKVSANSMYGAMGARQGYLPFVVGAATVTYIGRRSILKASEVLEKDFGGKVIYNDTDSAYTYFPHLIHTPPKEMHKVWSFALDVVDKIAIHFKAPMKLEFEEACYSRFLILTKKRYVGQIMTEEGKVLDKLKISGIVLKRRDNFKGLQLVYKNLIDFILNEFEHLVDIDKSLDVRQIMRLPIVQKMLDGGENMLDPKQNGIFRNMIMLMNRSMPLNYFLVVKSLKKDVYKGKTPPPHAVVANKMKERGIFVPTNARIEYVVLRNTEEFVDGSQFHKVEDLTYYKDFASVLRIDYLDYISKIIKPVDEVLLKMLNIQCRAWKREKSTLKNKGQNLQLLEVKPRGFTEDIVHWMICKDKVTVEIKRLFASSIECLDCVNMAFEDDPYVIQLELKTDIIKYFNQLQYEKQVLYEQKCDEFILLNKRHLEDAETTDVLSKKPKQKTRFASYEDACSHSSMFYSQYYKELN